METSKRKKNILFITILSVVGLIGAMALQMIWIYNSYELIKNDILNEGYATIEKALEEEGNMRFGEIRKNSQGNRNHERTYKRHNSSNDIFL